MAYEDEHFVDSTRMVWNYSLFEEEDIVRFRPEPCKMRMINSGITGRPF